MRCHSEEMGLPRREAEGESDEESAVPVRRKSRFLTALGMTSLG